MDLKINVPRGRGGKEVGGEGGGGRVFIVRIIWSHKLPVWNETTASSAQCATTAGILDTIRIIVVIRLLRQRSEK